MKDPPQTTRLGQGHAAAMGRSGLKEISQALVAFPAHSIQPVEETGLVGNLTPQEVVSAKVGQPSYQSMLESYSNVHGRTSREQERQPTVER